MALDPTFVYGNYVESCLWAGMGLVALVKRKSGWSLLLGFTLILFGASDVVEAHTGAWYSPWWLFAWKAACVLLIIWFGLKVWAISRHKPG
jgi:hypothetical protein